MSAHHATSNRRAPGATQVATCTTHHANYNAPHAPPCGTQNCQQRGSCTAEARAMLPPLNATDPASIQTTPPNCTPTPQSASAPIRLPMPRVPRLWFRRWPQTRTSRCRRTCRVHHLGPPAHGRGAPSLGDDDGMAHTHDATCSALYATQLMHQKQHTAARTPHAARCTARRMTYECAACMEGNSLHPFDTMQHAACNTLHPARNTQRASMQHTTYNMRTRNIPVQRGPCRLPQRQVSCNLQHATCILQHYNATCPHGMQQQTYVHRAQL